MALYQIRGIRYAWLTRIYKSTSLLDLVCRKCFFLLVLLLLCLLSYKVAQYRELSNKGAKSCKSLGLQLEPFVD